MRRCQWPGMRAAQKGSKAFTITSSFAPSSLTTVCRKPLWWHGNRCSVRVKTTTDASIRAGQKVAPCPGRRVEARPTPRTEYKFTDADPVNIRLTLLTINDVALAGVSGEVFTAQRLARESPLKPTIMVTHTNGSSGYIPSDDAFEPVSYEVTASRLKPGCAENAIVNGFLELIGSR
jgi:hypothetical protein